MRVHPQRGDFLHFQVDITINEVVAHHAARLEELEKKEVRILEELDEVRPTFIAKRGDFLSLGEPVSPATPAALHPFGNDLPRNRLGLARWLVDPANPLVARAYINRLWLELFGQGLVTTPEEFGSQGERPSHPELLDWLGVAFVEDDGWSLKKSLRRLVLSDTYCQSIEVNEASAALDPANACVVEEIEHNARGGRMS